MPLDQITQRRIVKFIEEFRTGSGELPTLRDLDNKGFGREVIKQALKDGLIEEFYLTLTNGTIVKGYKVMQST